MIVLHACFNIILRTLFLIKTIKSSKYVLFLLVMYAFCIKIIFLYFSNHYAVLCVYIYLCQRISLSCTFLLILLGYQSFIHVLYVTAGWFVKHCMGLIFIIKAQVSETCTCTSIILPHLQYSSILLYLFQLCCFVFKKHCIL